MVGGHSRRAARARNPRVRGRGGELTRGARRAQDAFYQLFTEGGQECLFISVRERLMRAGQGLSTFQVPPPPPPFVLSGHAASLTPY